MAVVWLVVWILKAALAQGGNWQATVMGVHILEIAFSLLKDADR